MCSTKVQFHHLININCFSVYCPTRKRLSITFGLSSANNKINSARFKILCMNSQKDNLLNAITNNAASSSISLIKIVIITQKTSTFNPSSFWADFSLNLGEQANFHICICFSPKSMNFGLLYLPNAK